MEELEEKQINALWTELPRKSKLITPDMHRIRQLAHEYDFLVICNETVGTLTYQQTFYPTSMFSYKLPTISSAEDNQDIIAFLKEAHVIKSKWCNKPLGTLQKTSVAILQTKP